MFPDFCNGYVDIPKHRKTETQACKKKRCTPSGAVCHIPNMPSRTLPYGPCTSGSCAALPTGIFIRAPETSLPARIPPLPKTRSHHVPTIRKTAFPKNKGAVGISPQPMKAQRDAEQAVRPHCGVLHSSLMRPDFLVWPGTEFAHSLPLFFFRTASPITEDFPQNSLRIVPVPNIPGSTVFYGFRSAFLFFNKEKEVRVPWDKSRLRNLTRKERVSCFPWNPRVFC